MGAPFTKKGAVKISFEGLALPKAGVKLVCVGGRMAHMVRSKSMGTSVAEGGLRLQ